jgi:hypothetical protein
LPAPATFSECTDRSTAANRPGAGRELPGLIVIEMRHMVV